jgi:hypothetical protein
MVANPPGRLFVYTSEQTHAEIEEYLRPRICERIALKSVDGGLALVTVRELFPELKSVRLDQARKQMVVEGTATEIAQVRHVIALMRGTDRATNPR